MGHIYYLTVALVILKRKKKCLQAVLKRINICLQAVAIKNLFLYLVVNLCLWSSIFIWLQVWEAQDKQYNYILVVGKEEIENGKVISLPNNKYHALHLTIRRMHYCVRDEVVISIK